MLVQILEHGVPYPGRYDIAMSDDVCALVRAAALLQALVEAEDPLGASEAARRAGTARNTAFRTLRTLAQLGWVTAIGEPPRYRISQEPARLFGRPWEHSSLTIAAHPQLKHLGQGIQETVYLAVRDGDRSVNVQVIEGHGMLRISGALGQGFPLHASAPGKVFLAFEPGLLERIIRRPLARRTPTTITTAAGLRQEIRRIRQQGWALNREELARGLVGIAAPIRDHSAACVAAMGILVPVSTCRSAEIHRRFGVVLQEAVAQTARALGYRGS